MSTQNTEKKGNGFPVLTGFSIGVLLMWWLNRKHKKACEKIENQPRLSTLKSLKAVSEIKVVTPVVLPKFGDRLMAGRDDLSIFTAQQTATGEYFNTKTKPFFGGNFDYGDHVGTYVGSKQDGEYLIDREGVKYFANKDFLKTY